MSATSTVGFIYPDHAAEDDYPRAAAQLGVNLPVVHIYGTDLHAIPELLDLGSPQRLAEGAELLANTNVSAVMWACTSGSFVYGSSGSRQQVAELAEHTGVPTSSTSLAYIAALRHLGVTKVAIAASYPHDVAALFQEFLAADGITTCRMSSANIPTAAEVGDLAPEAVADFVKSNDHPEAEAVLVPDTAMRTIELLPYLEQQAGKPVLSANQVTIWQGLRLAGFTPQHPKLGALFAEVEADVDR